MKWSLKLGRILGIDVHVHFTFLLLFAFIGMSHWMAGRSLAAAAVGMFFFLCLFACVLLHEYGHALMARRFGIPTRDITLLPIGGVARLERMPEKPSQELWVALAGPAVNVVIALGLALWLTLSGSWGTLTQLSTTEGGLVERLLAVNVFLVLFNLLPAFPMDGGRVLRALLAMRMDFARATRIAGSIGQGMAVLFGFIGLFSNPMLLLIALFVWIGAAQEKGAAQVRSATAGLSVQHAMVTEFRAVRPDDTLGDVARFVLAGSQQDFPVTEGGVAAGLLDRRRLLEGLTRLGTDAPVEKIMLREFPTVTPREMVDAVIARHHPVEFPIVPVVEGGRLVGLLTAENLMELLLIRSALENQTGRVTGAARLNDIVVRPPPLPSGILVKV